MIDEILNKHGLNRQTNGQYRGQCPFDENHTTEADGRNSFFVTPDINAYHCFSCGAKGHLLRLLLKRYQVPLKDAAKCLTFNTGEHSQQDKDREVEVMVDFSKPPRMFIRRGFTKETLRHFKVGAEYDKGFETAVIPIFNERKKLVAVKYRKSVGGKRKMWSTSFTKRFFYNQTKSKEVILVEGETDVWRSYQYGYDDTWGVLGSKINSEQLEHLKSLDKLFLALDKDAAGFYLSELLYQYLRKDVELKYILYPAEDPDKCTEEEWDESVNKAVPYAKYSLAMAKHKDYKYAKARAKKDFLKRKI